MSENYDSYNCAVADDTRYCAPTRGSDLNKQLWEPFHQILTDDVTGMSKCRGWQWPNEGLISRTEFMQYVFQILAQLLESSPPQDAMSEKYQAFLDAPDGLSQLVEHGLGL